MEDTNFIFWESGSWIRTESGSDYWYRWKTKGI